MISEEWFSHLCLGAFVACVLILFWLGPVSLTESTVEVRGVVEEVRGVHGATMARVRLTNSIPVVFFDARTLLPGQVVSVNGTLQSYEGRVEIVVE